MNPTGIRKTLIVEKAAWVRKMIQGIRRLPLDSYEDFLADSRNAAAAESYLRRGLEGLMDMGRHILAKGFGIAAAEYKDIADQLTRNDVLNLEEGKMLRLMAGYRNRLVHFYREISNEELYGICSEELIDVERVCDAMIAWLRKNPDKFDPTV